ASLGIGDGALVAVPGYVGAAIAVGHAFGQNDSGVRPAGSEFSGFDAFVLDDGSGNNRYPPQAASDGAGALSEAEVRGLLTEALRVAAHARAQIRQPLGSTARVTVSVSDRNGAVLGLVQSRDAPLFGIDVAVQKARTAVLLSASDAAGVLNAEADANYFSANVDLANASVALTSVGQSPIGNYVGAARGFLGLPTALGDTNNAFSVRAIGNLARPFYPDGIDGNPPGPFGRPFTNWSPFNDGLQLDVAYNAIALHIAWYLQQVGLSVSVDGRTLPALSDVTTCSAEPRLGTGIQIFPGGVPIYRGSMLVGAIGVSGDGVDQDDMVAFLGLDQAGAALGGAIGNAPPALRVDRLAPGNTHLRYVQCPQAPFIDSNESDPCGGR
ncbi:MAG: heme-binding protein, partial [Dokdonella sp.]